MFTCCSLLFRSRVHPQVVVARGRCRVRGHTHLRLYGAARLWFAMSTHSAPLICFSCRRVLECRRDGGSHAVSRGICVSGCHRQQFVLRRYQREWTKRHSAVRCRVRVGDMRRLCGRVLPGRWTMLSGMPLLYLELADLTHATTPSLIRSFSFLMFASPSVVQTAGRRHTLLSYLSLRSV